jgi:sn-glycerol 3-phosphate transport system substrate-binding protein
MPQTRTSWYSAATALVLVATLLLVPAPALAKTEIHLWHAMTGQLGEAVNELVKQFNESQAEYEVKPLRKGTYAETLTAAIAAYRQRQAPHIVQVFEVGTQTMMLSGAVLPVYQLMKEQESSTTTRTPSRRPGSIRASRPRPGSRSRSTVRS